MPVVHCPDCGAPVEVGPDARSGDLLDCPGCAGQALRLRGEPGHWSASVAHRVSCPRCEAVVTLPENARAGDTFVCCGRPARLTLEYGAFAAEETERRRAPAEPDAP